MKTNKLAIEKIKKIMNCGRKITALTCYHSLQAKILDNSGLDIVLVGDSLNMTLLGNPDTLTAELQTMVMLTKAVSKNVKNALVVGDMPYGSYGINKAETLKNACKFINEGGAGAVKLEGAGAITEHIKMLVEHKIPVMGHIGLLPQSYKKLGGFRVQGRTVESAQKLKKQAIELESAGVFSIVLECMPGGLAKEITQLLKIPTIGIGAGPHCRGQVLVIDDFLGMNPSLKLKHVKEYANLGNTISAAVKNYIIDVRNSKFPAPKNTFQ